MVSTLFKRKWLIMVALLAGLIAVGGVATLIKSEENSYTEDFKSEGETFSMTMAQAKKRGTLVAELEVTPSELRVDQVTVRFNEAWLEERALSTHRYVWFPYEKRVGG